MNNALRLLVSLGSCSLLGACGGGGGKDDPPPTNAAPAMQPQSFNATEDTALTGSIVASDAGDTLTYGITTQPAHGAMSAFSAAGAFTYQPASNYNGADTFTVRVTDSAGQVATATMTVNVSAVNDPPAAANDVLTLTTADAIDVLANDSDADNEPLSVSIVGASFPSGATVDANGRVSLPVAAGFKGLVRFRYRVRDAAGATADATALGFVGIAPLKTVFVGRPPATQPTDDRAYVCDLLACHSADGGVVAPIAGLDVSRNGRWLVYQQEVPVAGAPPRHALYRVDLSQPDSRQPVTDELRAGYFADRIAQTADGGQVIIALSDAGAGSSIHRWNAQTPATLATRISPPDSELQYAAAPWLNAAGTFVYYGGRAPAGGLAAAYRTDLSSGEIARVSPATPGRLGVGVDYVRAKPDDSLVISHELEENVIPGEPHYIVSLSNPATPNTSDLLHRPAPSAVSFDVPLLAPDGLHAVLFGSSVLTLTRTDMPRTETPIGSNNFAWQLLTTIPDRDRVMRADSQAALLVSGCGNPVQFPNTPCDVYEISFNDPANPARVNVASAAGEGATDPAYGADGARILFMKSAAGGARSLAVTKRGAFGAQQTVSANAAESVTSYVLDASGYVVMYRSDVPGSADDKYYVANVDAPGEVLDVGLSAGAAVPFALVAR
jgi:hypothetical protein